MRAFQIALFLMILQASVVFVTDAGIFEHSYLENASLAKNTYSTYSLSNITDYTGDATEPSTWDYFTISVRWIVDGLFMIIKAFVGVVFIAQTLVVIFKVPIPLAGLLQVGVYFIYYWGYMEWKSNRGTRYME